MSGRERRMQVLVLSWNYPNPAGPQRGLWVERMCEAAARDVDVRVIVPTPWTPPLLPVRALSRFRDVPRRERRGAVEIEFPRVLGSVEYLTHDLDARLAAQRLRAVARRMHEERPFDLIHAHFIYPDGVVASQIGRDLSVPVMTSEHSFWTPWLQDQTRASAQVRKALPYVDLVAADSEFVRASVVDYLQGTSPQPRTTVLPEVVDDRVFLPGPETRDPDELLFVGLIRRFKRLDVLLRALTVVRAARPATRLRILSAKAFAAYAKDRRMITSLIAELGLEPYVTIVNGSSPAEVAQAMRRCSLVVVPSVREAFCAVAAEALACGTPLVVTRCGGPEEFVTEADGVMVEPDDPEALAAGILRAFERRESFRESEISARIIGRFGLAAWGDQSTAIYKDLVRQHREGLQVL